MILPETFSVGKSPRITFTAAMKKTRKAARYHNAAHIPQPGLNIIVVSDKLNTKFSLPKQMVEVSLTSVTTAQNHANNQLPKSSFKRKRKL
jgi:hypothetical protein